MEAKAERRSALAIAMLSSFLTPFLASSIVLALPTIGHEFSISTVTASWIANAYLLTAAAFLVPFGRIADIRGRKWLFLNGMWVFSAGTVLCMLAPSVELLLIFRVIEGIGSAMVFGTSVAIVTSVYPANQRGKALGLTTMLVYVGLSAGPVLGGALTEFLSWRAIFGVVLPLCAAIMFVGYRWLVGEWKGAEGEKFDLKGSVVYGLSLTGIILGLTLLPNLLAAISTVVGLAGIYLFSRLEKRIECPVLDTKLFSENRAFAFSNIAALINYSATFAVTFMMSFYLQVEKGFSADYAGIILVSQPVLMAAFSPVAGRLSDFVEPQYIASIGMAITATGLVLLALLTTNSPLLVIVLSLAILGFGFAFFSSPNTNAIMTSVERKCYGIASATVGTMRLVGQTLSIAVATLFISLYVGNVEVQNMPIPTFHDAFRTSFIVFAALCFIGVFASLARGKVHE
jgi:EmrB/QacA subfamily drug resistance transporter